MRKFICMLAAMLLLAGCSQSAEPGNPYRLKKTTMEYFYRDRET